jgi:HSP20 family protein
LCPVCSDRDGTPQRAWTSRSSEGVMAANARGSAGMDPAFTGRRQLTLREVVAHGCRSPPEQPIDRRESTMAEQKESAVTPRASRFSELDPWKGLDPFRGLLDRFFLHEPPETWRQLETFTTPKVDITETDDEYRVRAELPGVSKDDVTVEFEHGLLTIRGEKKSQRDEKTEKGRRLECSYGAFSRSFSLPQDIDADRIAATFKDGVLDVTVKRTPTSKPKQVAIKG